MRSVLLGKIIYSVTGFKPGISGWSEIQFFPPSQPQPTTRNNMLLIHLWLNMIENNRKPGLENTNHMFHVQDSFLDTSNISVY